jgi:hypothetical protein
MVEVNEYEGIVVASAGDVSGGVLMRQQPVELFVVATL